MKLPIMFLLASSPFLRPVSAEGQASPHYCREVAAGDAYHEALCAHGERAAYERLMRQAADPTIERHCLAIDLKSWALLEQCIRLEESKRSSSGRIRRASQPQPPAAEPPTAVQPPRQRQIQDPVEQRESLLAEVDRRINERLKALLSRPTTYGGGELRERSSEAP
jgi:hypothetical protein